MHLRVGSNTSSMSRVRWRDALLVVTPHTVELVVRPWWCLVARLRKPWGALLRCGHPPPPKLTRPGVVSPHLVATPPSRSVVAALGPALQDDLSLHHHVADKASGSVGTGLLPVAESGVRHDRRLQLPVIGGEEVVGIGAGCRLTRERPATLPGALSISRPCRSPPDHGFLVPAVSVMPPVAPPAAPSLDWIFWACSRCAWRFGAAF
jgi:hypothetical protein